MGGSAAAGVLPPAEVGCWMLLYPRLAALCQEARRRAAVSMTETAVLFALQATGTAEVRALRRSLLADAGHLSRILAALESGGLLTRATSATDSRQQQVTLTASGAGRCAALGLILAQAAREISITPAAFCRAPNYCAYAQVISASPDQLTCTSAQQHDQPTPTGTQPLKR